MLRHAAPHILSAPSFRALSTAPPELASFDRHLSLYLQRLQGPLSSRSRILSRLQRPDLPAVVSGQLATGVAAEYSGLSDLNVVTTELPKPTYEAILLALTEHKAGTRIVARMRADALQHRSLRPFSESAATALRPLLDSVRVRRVQSCAPDSLVRLLAEGSARRSPHPVDDTSGMAHRLRKINGRIFAAFHPAAPGHPLAVVEATLCSGVPSRIADVLQYNVLFSEEKHRTAVFYSIVVVEPGLAGLGLGAKLIKETINRLMDTEVEKFVTLSPLPSFRKWLQAELPRLDLHFALGKGSKEEMLDAAVQYLVKEKNADGGVLDPVANFHMGNGAHVAQIVIDADLSERRIAESFGVMVVYEYCEQDLRRNQIAYLNGNKIPVKFKL